MNAVFVYLYNKTASFLPLQFNNDEREQGRGEWRGVGAADFSPPTQSGPKGGGVGAGGWGLAPKLAETPTSTEKPSVFGQSLASKKGKPSNEDHVALAAKGGRVVLWGLRGNREERR